MHACVRFARCHHACSRLSYRVHALRWATSQQAAAVRMRELLIDRRRIAAAHLRKGVLHWGGWHWQSTSRESLSSTGYDTPVTTLRTLHLVRAAMANVYTDYTLLVACVLCMLNNMQLGFAGEWVRERERERQRETERDRERQRETERGRESPSIIYHTGCEIAESVDDASKRLIM